MSEQEIEALKVRIEYGEDVKISEMGMSEDDIFRLIKSLNESARKLDKTNNKEKIQ